MRFRTLEIRWHDSKPISTCDFQPVSFKKARPPAGQERNYTTQSYRLATGGEDNHVRVWMVHPNIRPPNVVSEADPTAAAGTVRPPRVEYLATLSRHSAAVNVLRFSPNGELIASAGDDGMIIIWAPSTSPQATTYGSDLSQEDLQHEKEYWKPRTTFRCTTMQVYDLAWSPTGEYIVAGSTDNTARVFAAVDGKCVYEIAEHSHYVQGVAWDPLNEYIATQSSDRSMHIYRITSKPLSNASGSQAGFELHAVGKNTKMPHRHSRTPSAHGGPSRPRMYRRESTASDVESVFLTDTEDYQSTSNLGPPQKDIATPLTPATSVGSAPTNFMFPPPIDSSSRRSSFSGSNAPGSPSPSTTFSTPCLPTHNPPNHGRYGRSPSPMPPLPAIRSLPSPSTQNAAMARAAQWASVRLYGDESYTNFFRRLGFSPDGGLLLTPAGQFEDPSVIVGENTPSRGRKGHPSEFDVSNGSGPPSASSVYIYSRANFARPPIAQLPGHKKASVAVRFSPILYELRSGVSGAGNGKDEERQDQDHKQDQKAHPPMAVLEKGIDGYMDVDVVGTSSAIDQPAAIQPTPSPRPGSGAMMTPQRATAHAHSSSSSGIITPSPRPTISTSGFGNSAHMTMPSPALSPMDLKPPTPLSKPSTPVPGHTYSSSQSHQSSAQGASSVAATSHSSSGNASIFALPYRMLFAVVTMDTVAIYDTQQASPVCMLTKLHYDEFTDMTWSPDGQCLILSSRDGYCTLIMFDDILPAYHTQQHTLQLQSIAHQHSVPLSFPSPNSHYISHSHSHSHSSASAQATPSATPATATVGLPSLGQLPSSTPTVLKKRTERPDPPLTPAASIDGSDNAAYFSSALPAPSVPGSSDKTKDEPEDPSSDKVQEPPKKKRRVALTRVGDLEP